MGFSKKLFLDTDHASFICSKCDGVAIDPMDMVCCGSVLCRQCFEIGCNCSHDHSDGNVSTPLSGPTLYEYYSLRMKCYKCVKVVTIGTLGIHYENCIKEKLDKLEETFENVSELNQFYREKCQKLEQENEQLKNTNNELKRTLAAAQDSNQSKAIDIDQRGIENKNIVPKRFVLAEYMYVDRRSTPRVLQPDLTPKFILDAVESKSVPYGMIETLEQLILEQCSDGVKQPMKQFFEPIRLGMNRTFKGNWQNYDASMFDPNRAKCKRDREIHYSIDWNILSLGTTKHVTFDLNSNAVGATRKSKNDKAIDEIVSILNC